MSDPGDQPSTTMANTEAPINDGDHNDPFHGLENFCDAAAESKTLNSVAAYEDPMDDLTVFFENAISWACTKTLKGPAGTFYLFAELPSEIRMMVWKECIPSQIHLVAERVCEGVTDDKVQITRDIMEDIRDDYTGPPVRLNRVDRLHRVIFGCEPPIGLRFVLFDPDRASPYNDDHCGPFFPSTFHQKLPFIARINREARDVALTYVNQHIKMCHNLALVHVDRLADVDRIDESPVWMNIKTDTVLVNDAFLDPEDHPETAIFRTDDGTPHIKTNRLLGMVDRNMVKTAILVDVLEELHPFTFRRLVSGQSVQVVVGIVDFSYSSVEQAARTDLFGLFGEENMALITVNNPSLLRKLFLAHSEENPTYKGDLLESGIPYYTTLKIPARGMTFHEYNAVMENLAYTRMTMAMYHVGWLLHDNPFKRDEKATTEWREEVWDTFHSALEPVFLAHRCHHPTLHRDMD